ncbi:MAG: NAD-dependent epimerase/dehydratase family protein [Candidatus Nitrosopumilus sp. bin_7KS]
MRNFKNSSILVTGGTGAVGTNLVNKLLDFGAKVIVLDDFSQSKKINLKSSKNLTIIKGDINNKKILEKIFLKKIDYVFHLAARFANELSVKDPVEDLHVNIQGTLQVLLYASKQKLKRFVYTSSSSLYGNQNETINEKTIPNPSTPYAVSKLTGEYYCKAMNQLYNLKYTIVRLSNSYGPFDPSGRFRNVIPNFFQSALSNKNIIITGTGNETRDFTYVDDTVNGILLAAISNNSINEVFNLGTGKETSIKNIAKMIIEITNSKSKIIFKPKRSFDHINRRKMNISKARKLIKYNPKININEGLRKTYDWMLQN